jgi:hypothetical protein
MVVLTRQGYQKNQQLWYNLAGVVKDVGIALESRFGVKLNFTLAGSYPASVVANHEFGIQLEFNNIDVFVLARHLGDQLPNRTYEGSQYLSLSNMNIVHSETMEGVIQQAPISVNVIVIEPTSPECPCSPASERHAIARRFCAWHGFLRCFVQSLDINAVQVGFHITWDYTYFRWRISSREASSAFMDFIKTKTLCIPTIRSRLGHEIKAGSIIRMALKSEQLGLNMKFPWDTAEVMRQPFYHPEWVVLNWDRLSSDVRECPDLRRIEVTGPVGPKKYHDCPTYIFFYDIY